MVYIFNATSLSVFIILLNKVDIVASVKCYIIYPKCCMVYTFGFDF